ncbi:MAG: lamin tail domain-containing protein, partial [Paludibacter sp.]|nr:lamin tail domain-containing protein [Paludibacter sp.]
QNKAIELYNGTGKTLDLSNYLLMKQSDGVGDFKAPNRLSGTLENNRTFLVTLNNSQNELEDIADAVFDSEFSFNGNDALALYHNGIMIDVIGYVDAGSALVWGEDKTLKRKSTVTHPTTRYDENQWNTYPKDYFNLLGSHQISFQAQEVPILQSVSTQAKPFFVVTGLNPESTYNYSVDVIEPVKTTRSVNSGQFTTTGLPTPEVNAAKDIQSSQFTANWEPDLYTNNYLLNVFQLAGSDEKTIVEGFDNIGSNGKPLPEGWSGTASGSYTTAASSGVDVPSLQLKNTGEYVQTKEFPHLVKSFSFMYRFPSSGTGSYFILQALQGENWIKIDSIAYSNTSKYYPTYNFTIEDNVTAFRITYYKITGNFALDDFSITYGNQEEAIILENEPVTGTERVVGSLNPQTDYYYSVRSVIMSNVSPFSETVKVTTAVETGLTEIHPEIKIIKTADGILLSGLTGGEVIRIYSIAGVLYYQNKATEYRISIPLKFPEIYILSLQHKDYSLMEKIVR